jgi:hypothetical protein
MGREKDTHLVWLVLELRRDPALSKASRPCRANP